MDSVLPEDFVKFGLIPEFIGRVPVTVSLDLLDEEALMRILVEPKNALTKQYKKLMELDDIKLSYGEDALREVARLSSERKTGARGLRAILETGMVDAMFELPSREDVDTCVITKDVIDGTGKAKYLSKDGSELGSELTEKESVKLIEKQEEESA